eukprot:1147962-Pelagomonas_calceolata.AAC.2
MQSSKGGLENRLPPNLHEDLPSLTLPESSRPCAANQVAIHYLPLASLNHSLQSITLPGLVLIPYLVGIQQALRSQSGRHPLPPLSIAQPFLT